MELSSLYGCELLQRERLCVESLLEEAMQPLKGSGELEEACCYAVLNPGKRLRPILLRAIAQSLGCPWNLDRVTASVEFFHCTSLIADDLPCMDDDDMRRGRPTLHRVYGEAVAILASYALIAEGYRALYLQTKELIEAGVPEAAWRGLLAVENVAHNAGIEGASGGQYLDLKQLRPTIEQFQEMLSRKTASVFEISAVLGWLFGGGELEKLEQVKQMARHLAWLFSFSTT